MISQIRVITEGEKNRLLAVARQALAHAYAPYSNFRVGAAVLTQTGQIFAGCNVENVSYGLSMCAERNAIASAVLAEGGDTMKIKAIAVVNHRNIPCSPCGACRQVIWEFGKTAIVIYQGDNQLEVCNATELLPAGFSF
ncbi:MAG: cytidine deaminase [Pleurocapsa sp.]